MSNAEFIGWMALAALDHLDAEREKMRRPHRAT